MRTHDGKWRGGRLAVLALLLAFAAPAPGISQPEQTMDPGWPREVTQGGAKLVYYQPQIDEWQDYKQLAVRMAFALTPAGGKEVLGVAEFRAATVVDMETRTVVVKSIDIVGTRFPSLDDQNAKSMEALFRKLVPTPGMTLSLDRVTAGLERAREAARPVAVKTDPPTIFTAEDPTILLLVDGKPVLAGIEGTGLEFVVNTNWDVFFDKGGSRYYLLDDKTWLAAPALNGPWQPTTSLPADMAKLPAGQDFDDVRRAVPAKAGSGQAPRVFYCDGPAELIAFDGRPVYANLPGTRLVYAKNTDSDVFVQSDQNAYYVLLSGRWFRATALAGPWAYAGGDLPADFAKIPHDSPKAHVLASVPGTEEAADAVLLAQIPTTAVVTRSEAEAKARATYDGDPKFAPIENTALSYATNTEQKVIKVGDLYYMCFQAVWFVSTSPTGPWKTADSVPAEIYSIPPSSPVYNVTYVVVSEPTPTTVTCSYTSGYMGAFVIGFALGAAVVYGTGYYYPPYIWYPPYGPYPIYHPYPYTYGVRAVYNPYTGAYGIGHYAYGPYGGAGQAAWYNPATGRYGRAATVQTPYGGRTVARTYNPYTGVRTATAQGSSPYAQWGSTAVQRGSDWAVTHHVTTSQGTVRWTDTSKGGQAVSVHGENGTTRVISDANNNVYAGHDGNVYKRDADGNWSKYDSGGWSDVTRPSGADSKAGTRPTEGTKPTGAGRDAAVGTNRPAPSSVPTDVQRDAASRQMGAQRADQFSRARAGGGQRGGGGGRRR